MYGAEWNFLAVVVSGIVFSYGLLLFAFGRGPAKGLFRRSRSAGSRGTRLHAEKENGVTVFTLYDAHRITLAQVRASGSPGATSTRASQNTGLVSGRMPAADSLKLAH